MACSENTEIRKNLLSTALHSFYPVLSLKFLFIGLKNNFFSLSDLILTMNRCLRVTVVREFMVWIHVICVLISHFLSLT